MQICKIVNRNNSNSFRVAFQRGLQKIEQISLSLSLSLSFFSLHTFIHIYCTHIITHILSYIHSFTSTIQLSLRLTFTQSSSLITVFISTETKQPPQQLRKVREMAQTNGAHDFSHNSDGYFVDDGQVYDSRIHYLDPMFGAMEKSIRAAVESMMASAYQHQPHASGASPPVSPMLHSQRRTRKADVIPRDLRRPRHHLRLRIPQHHSSKA